MSFDVELMILMMILRNGFTVATNSAFKLLAATKNEKTVGGK